MGFIRIFETSETPSGWRSVWESGDPQGTGWEAVRRNSTRWEVRQGGVVRGWICAPRKNWAFQGLVRVGRDTVPVGDLSISGFPSAEAVAEHCARMDSAAAAGV
ncbi:hypothetical protein OHS33_39025 (plasmid) [Streptomyces sp. NBC_00536]|uniref:hypothetical protein n=1 Tax=Streptomyces sp. NBC_00536 TaxID=2975769 RepID=UPI002E8096EB|nr:hypothetical protein [Streptomyces sp. NBC_00536]WUC84352.1 hypothetical protein OHS33_39025 [Streptomyces sp. NBC_00536]